MFSRVKSVLRGELNARNRIDTINSLAIPVITQRDQKGCTKIHKLLTIHFNNDWILKLEKKNKRKIKACTLFLAMRRKYLNQINRSNENISENSTSTEKAKQIKTQAKPENINELKGGWKDKPLHGKYPIHASDPEVNSSLTHQWLGSFGPKSETESFIIAAQDHSLPTRNFQANILENGADLKCRVCDKHPENIDHLVSDYPILTSTEYLNRHDRFGQYIHWCLCKNVCLPHERN